MLRPLVSLKGGKVKLPKAPGKFLGMPGYGGGALKTGRYQVVKAPTPKKPATTTTPSAGGTTGAGTSVSGGSIQDPFKFIQSLMQGSDPASIRALVDSVYAPSRQAINDQIAQSQANALARAQQMEQVYGAFAQYMGGLSGNLASIYQAGKADGNALTAGMSGPTGSVGDHLANMQGIQNTYLGAMSDAEKQLGASMPGVYSLMATQQVKQMLNAATASQDQLRAKLLDLSSQEASDILKYLDSAQQKDVQLKEWAYGQSASQASQSQSQLNNYFNLLQKNAGQASNNVYLGGGTAKQAQAAFQASWNKGIAGMRASGLITAQQARQLQGLGSGIVPQGVSNQQRVDLGLSKQYGQLVDAYGNPILRNGKPVPLPKGATSQTIKYNEAASRQQGVIMGINSQGQLVPIPGPNGQPVPYKAASAKAGGNLVPAKDSVSKAYKMFMLYNKATGQYVPARGPDGKVRPYVPSATGTTKASYTAKDLGTAQKGIQTDISTRKFRNVDQAITYYLNMYGGLVRAGYRASITRFVRQAWATQVGKRTKGSSSSGVFGGGNYKP